MSCFPDVLRVKVFIVKRMEMKMVPISSYSDLYEIMLIQLYKMNKGVKQTSSLLMSVYIFCSENEFLKRVLHTPC